MPRELSGLKPKFFLDGMKRVACIPFMRNLLEYTKGTKDADYEQLCSLLHWKADTEKITQSNLDDIYSRLFGSEEVWGDPSQLVFEHIFEEAKSALEADSAINLEEKIVLSIAIRLAAEAHMIRAINNSTITGALTGNATRKLYDLYKQHCAGVGSAGAVLNSVLLMTPENIHINAFMYEPIIDMDDGHLRELYRRTQALESSARVGAIVS